MKLTNLYVKKKQYQGRQEHIMDDTSFGYSGQLGIRVGKKKKSWFVSYRFDGKRKKVNIGSYPSLGVADARILAAEKLKNPDPSPAPILRESPTVDDLWLEYQKAMDCRRKPKAPHTRVAELGNWNNHIKSVIGHMKVGEIKRSHVASLLNSIAIKYPVQANRLHSLLNMMFVTGLDLGWIEVHPMYMLSKPGGPETPRQRYLSDDEIRVVWPHFPDYFKLGLYTAQRPGEILRMRQSDLDLDNRVWKLSATKTGNPHLVPLSPQVYDILLASEKFPSQTGFVREQVQKKSGITGWTAHDLRRTARTIMSRLQIQQHIRERVLNHSQGGIVAVYDQYDYLPEKRDALEKLADEIDKIVS